jgi:ribosome-binding protein aMBF1 (putative translation factor)
MPIIGSGCSIKVNVLVRPKMEACCLMSELLKTGDEILVRTLAQVLERRRQEVGISQEELSKRAGISRTYLSDIERGLRNISVGTLTKLAAAMAISPSKLLATAEAEVSTIDLRRP